MNYKKFGILFIIIFIISIGFILLFNVIIDPYFHYHKPLKNINYYLNDERHQNYGIVKHFEYDSLITGTSMTQNFKTSEFDELFNANAIKVSLSGAYYKEQNDLLNVALKHNSNIKYIVRSLDYSMFYKDKDEYSYKKDLYPTYLYNNNLIDDIKYVLNKEVLFNSISNLNNHKSTTFDEYSYWGNTYTYGKKSVDLSYYYGIKYRQENLADNDMNDNDVNIIKSNVKQNVINLIKEYPNVEFYLFYPPYSIYGWDYYKQIGELNKHINGEKFITEMLLEYDNVHVFSFLDEYNIITNLNNYKDTRHYSADINSYILKSMSTGKNELTKDNYKAYYDKIINYYNNYDYNSLFK